MISLTDEHLGCEVTNNRSETGLIVGYTPKGARGNDTDDDIFQVKIKKKGDGSGANYQVDSSGKAVGGAKPEYDLIAVKDLEA